MPVPSTDWNARRDQIQREHMQRWRYHRLHPMGVYAAHASHETTLRRQRDEQIRALDEAEATEGLIDEAGLHTLRQTALGQAALDAWVDLSAGHQVTAPELHAAATGLEKDRRISGREASRHARRTILRSLVHKALGNHQRAIDHRDSADRWRLRAQQMASSSAPHRVLAPALREAAAGRR